LPNRNLFTDRLEMALRRFRRFPTLYFAVFFIDLDSFKQVNDGYGHDVGDQLLKIVAQILQSCVRANDTVARLGGDEFTILLDSITNIAEVRNVAERIQEKLNAPLSLSEQVIASGASIGIVLSDFRYKQAADLVKDADTALYQAKQNGKSQYAIFEH
jgi:diguanylate cyclase (GGDEF)-like protein